MIHSEVEQNTGVSEARVEEKLEKHKEEAKKTISALNPIQDFKDMISYKYEDLTLNGMLQMKDMILKFILESFKGSYYIKAIECIKVLREAAIEDDEVEFFNSFLEELKQNFPKEKFVDLWRLIIDNRISLIFNTENMKSVITEKQSDEWLESMSKKEIISSTLNDLDDLIADID